MNQRYRTILPLTFALFPSLALAQDPALPADAPRAEAAPAAEPAPPAAEAPEKAGEPPAAEPLATSPAPAAEPAPVALAMPAPVEPEAAEPSLLPLKVTTSALSRFESRSNYDSLGVSQGRFTEGDAIFFRARLGFQTAPLDLKDGLKALVQFSPQASGRWGVTGTTVEPRLGIAEGYLRFFGDRASVDAGRFIMDYGDSLVIGNLDWHEAGRSFDGVRASYKLGKEKAFLDAFATLTSRNGLDPAEGHPVYPEFFGGDNYFWGVYAGLGPLLKEKLDLDAYLLGVSNVETPNYVDPVAVGATPGASYTRSGATEMTFGARIKDKVGDLDYRAEAGIQFGTRAAVGATASQDVFAYQADAEVGYSFTKKIRVGLEGLVASGNDPSTTTNEAWNALYATHHKFLGLMDVIGLRSNVASAVLHASAGLTDSLKVLVDAHLYRRLHLQPTQVGNPMAVNQGGYEVNAGLLQKLGAPAHVRGLYGIFVPDAGYPSSVAAHYVELEASLKF